jgi:monoamine oxidase
MSRTPLAARLGRLVEQVRLDADGGDAPTGERTHPSRRQLLRGGALLAGVATVETLGMAPARAAAPRVVVVGAGLAGLSAAYRLRQAGYQATVYEASDRVGGRCWTLRGAFADSQLAERGGELIDQGHTAVRQLAQSLGLTLDNLLSAEVNGTEPLYWFDGAPYTYAQATDDIKTIWQQLHADVSAASYPTLFDSYTARGYQLDLLSITDWISAYVPGGLRSRLGRLLDVAYTIEYGGESSIQSSLNMLYLLAYSGQGQLRIFGPSNEKYHVSGGNDQITQRLAAALPRQIQLGTRLVALRDVGDGSWQVTVRKGTKATTVTADHVVLALPFSLLRDVDLTQARFPALTLTAIRELPMGTNSKLHVQFDRRLWAAQGCTGETFADTGYQNTWEVSRAQPGTSGLLVDYTGGAIGNSFTGATATTFARRFLTQAEPVLPGLTKAWNGRASLDYWAGNPWTKGSYSYWKVGQYTGFSGIESRAVGSCHFAGEHTSQDFQGYLNGAVETGQRAASEILAATR